MMGPRTGRRRFLGTATAAATVSLFPGSPVLAARPARTMQTYTYKKVGKLAIKLDLYRSSEEGRLPLAVWIHGGALINGHRE